MFVEEQLQTLLKRATWIPDAIDVLRPDTEYPVVVTSLDSALKGALSRRALLLPNLRDSNETIFVASDYGGESSDSRYFTYSFMVIAYDGAGDFVDAQRTLRANTGLDTEEIAFECRQDGPLRRALPQYLANLNNLIRGILVTVVVDKNVRTLWGSDRKDTHNLLVGILAADGLTSWKGPAAEKMLNIVHLVSYLVALLSRNGQKVFWMTDDDPIAANAAMKTQLGVAFGRVLDLYAGRAFKTVEYGTPPSKRPIFPFELDILSCADLAAGTLDHFYNRKLHAVDGEYTVDEEANKIAIWLSQQGILLKRLLLSIKKEDDAFVTRTIVLTPGTLPSEYVPISLPLHLRGEIYEEARSV